jgi:Uma2 family endonuclease
MTAPSDKRYQLLDGEMILAPSPIAKHQRISRRIFLALEQAVESGNLGELFYAPFDVVLSDYDVFQPDLLFVSNQRSSIITEANIQGAPDLVVEVLSPGSAVYDRGYKRTLYSRSGVREYWLVDPDAEMVEVLMASDQGLVSLATYRRSDTLTSPLLAGLALDLESIFG